MILCGLMWKREIMSVWPREVVIYTDGASRGNPGPASYGIVVLSKEGQEVLEGACLLGEVTNSVAEYEGVRKALELASLQKNVEKVTLKSDSQFLIYQLQGKYKVKTAHLKPLFEDCLKHLKKIPQTQLMHIPREQNTHADKLANQILDGILEHS